MVLPIAPSLYLFYGALRVDLDFHLFSHPHQEFTRILHSPSYVGNRKSGDCRNRLRAYLHLERQLQGMIGSVDVEGSVRCQFLGSLSGFERAFEVRRMEEDGGITIALQHLILHSFVASGISTLAGGRVHEDLSLGDTGRRVENELSTLQLESSLGWVQAAAYLPVNLGLCWIEQDLQTSILRQCQMGTDDDNDCKDAANSFQFASPLCEIAQPQRGRVPKQEISERPLAEMHSQQVGEELWLA